MLADIIILAIVGVLFVLCIRKQITDYKKGIPSCGLSCPDCSSCSGCSSACAGRAPKASKRLKAKKGAHEVIK